jgi:hypothetical protein
MLQGFLVPVGLGRLLSLCPHTAQRNHRPEATETKVHTIRLWLPASEVSLRILHVKAR